MTWPNDIQSNTPAPYQFELLSSIGNIICDKEPMEWKSGVIEENRDLEAGGVFSSFILDTLTFVGTGARLLKDLWAADEFNAECVLVVSWFKNSIRDYVEMPSRYKINFRDYNIVKIGGFAFGVQVNAINSSTQTKLDNRSKLNIDITKLVSVGGFNIVDYPDLLKDFRFGDINSYFIGKWTNQLQGSLELSQPEEVTVQMFNNLSDYTEAQDVSQAIVTDYKNQSSFKESLEDRTIDLTLSTTLRMNVPSVAGTYSYDCNIYYKRINSSGAVVESDSIGYMLFDSATQTKSQAFTDSRQISISTGESFGYFVEITFNTGTQQTYEIRTTNTAQDTSESSLSSDATTIEAFPVYEAGDRLCQHILDSQFSFYSEFLGRLDTPYNLNGDFYLSENQLRFASIMSGLNLRGEALSDINNPLTISFDKYFKSIKAWWNVGYTLETIDGFERIRFENYDFFFDDSAEFDLSERINIYDIVSEAMPKLAYLSLISGYKEFDYEEINGRGEYNSKNERSSIIATDSIFDNVCDFRGDTKGITLQLERSVTSDGTKDEKEDNRIFIVKSQRSAEVGQSWKAETDENITVNNNTSLFQEGSLNLYSTPTRNLVRNSNRFTPAYQKMLSSKLRFQTSGKLQTLQTTGEGYTVTENEDLVVNNMNDPIYKAMKHTVEVQFDFDDLEDIRGKLIRFTPTLTGYLLNLKKKNNEDKATISIIEKYV